MMLFFFFFCPRTAVINLLAVELMAFYTVKKKRRKEGKKGGAKNKLFGIMKGLFWERAWIRGHSLHAAAGLPARPHPAAQPEQGRDADEPSLPRPSSPVSMATQARSPRHSLRPI